MRWRMRDAMALAGLVACACSQAPATVPPAPVDPSNNETSGPKAQRQKASQPHVAVSPSVGCIVRVSTSPETRVGRYPSLEVQLDPPVQHHGGPEPTLRMTVHAPDESARTIDYSLAGQPTCAFCLPSGPGGCDHSCEYPEVSELSESFGRSIKVPGEHRLSFELVNYACELEAERDRIEVLPAQR